MIYSAVDMIRSRARHGESAVWCPGEKACLFCDCKDRYLWKLKGDSGEAERIPLEFIPRAVAENEPGGYLGISGDSVFLLDGGFRITETVKKFSLRPGEMFNDCRPGPDGALYLGTYGTKERNNRFFRLDPEGNCRVLLDGVTCSNGFVWTRDRKTVYYTDTFRHEISSFDFGKEGELSGRKTVFSDPDRLPDGLTIDSRGFLWSAIWGKGEVIQIDPATGGILDIVKTEPHYSSSCAFAGTGSSMLYITTSRNGVSAGETSPDGVETAGDVYAAEVTAEGCDNASWQGAFVPGRYEKR